ALRHRPAAIGQIALPDADVEAALKETSTASADSPINSRKKFREPRACRRRMDLREGWRCYFSEAVEARARLRDKTHPNQPNLLCQAPPAPGNLTPSQGEGAMNTTSENQAATVRDQEGWPHRVIRRGEAVRPLPSHARSLADLAFDVREDRRSVVDYM